MTLPPFGPGPTAMPPKLPVAEGIACCALNGPQGPEAGHWRPARYHASALVPVDPHAAVAHGDRGWSTLPVPAVTGALNVTPPSVLKITLIWLTLLLM